MEACPSASKSAYANDRNDICPYRPARYWLIYAAGAESATLILEAIMSEALPLSAVEARILGVLVEKQHTTPDVYPLTLNALVAACNQKTSRDPVMNLADADVMAALDELRDKTLLIESYGASGRVMRYAQNLDRVMKFPAPILALMAVLMLRGPQTPGELRTNADRLYHFPDISALEAYLEELIGRNLVLRLPRQPGSREHRYAHLLCGAPPLTATRAEDETLELDQSATLRREIAELRALVEHLYAELGITKPRDNGP